jgi:hypothetical protein
MLYLLKASINANKIKQSLSLQPLSRGLELWASSDVAHNRSQDASKSPTMQRFRDPRDSRRAPTNAL